MAKTFFTSIFAQFNDVESLRTYAQNVVQEINEAFVARATELENVKTHDKQPATKVEVKPATKAKGKKAKTPTATEVAPTPEPAIAVKAEKKAAKKSTDEDEISITEKGLIGKLGLSFTQYNERCWVLRGNTKPIKNALKSQFDAKYNRGLKGGEGWIFNNDNAVKCAKALGFKVKTA